MGDQKIAIVGYACRLPGQVSTPEDLWELCTRSRSGWSEIPKERFSSDAYYHPNALKPGTFNTKGGYFLKDDISKFDAPFFNLTEKEAISLDPQQRLLLECTFEALENAGIPKESYAGRRVGVYVGGNIADYELANVRDLETTPQFQATGCAPAMQANRLSHFFDFRGPSMTFDTACSGSLVALHHAVKSIAHGESTEAVVAGCRLNIAPDTFVTMSTSQLLNDEGKTFAFDERGNSGFARGEGAGVVILKSLEAALRDNDAIRAVIVNSGVGQDGRTLGITNPNGEAQRDLIDQVYRDAHLDPRDCGFAEMHGTGTKVGDPIEAKAVYQSLSHLRSPQDPLYIGSVKSNVGHLEGASGVISVIKASLMLEKKLVLPNVNFRSPNPAIPLDEWNMKVLKTTRPWRRGKKYVSVSNYGFGGTSCHAILEMAPAVHTRPVQSSHSAGQDSAKKLFVLSAHEKDVLQSRLKDLSIYFEQRPEVFENGHCANVAYTLGSRRSHLTYRIAIPASSLDDCGRRMTQKGLVISRSLAQPKIGLTFTGQGANWARMGVDLLDVYPVFASSIERADKHLRTLGAAFSLVEELRLPKGKSRITTPEISQPSCTAIQIGLVNLFRSWGIQPDSVVGHSSGEIAAAYAVGAFDADDAMALAFHRGNMTLKLKEMYPDLTGGMIAVGVGPDEIESFLSKITTGYATIACFNSPSSVTVSGDGAAIEELHRALDLEGIFNRQLPIDVAYHSEHMARVSDLYLRAISKCLPSSRLSGKFFSSVYGRQLDDASVLGPCYWVRNLVSPVQFTDALHQMCIDSERPDMLIEIGPHGALKGPIRDIMSAHGIPGEKITYTSSLMRNADAMDCVLSAAGVAFGRGVSIGLKSVNFPRTQAEFCALLTDMPRYPWQHSKSYWHQSRIPQEYRSRSGQKRNDVLGLIAAYSNDLEPTWRNIVRLDDIPWLRHHKMQGMPVFPFAGYLAMAIEAVQRCGPTQPNASDNFELREVSATAALVLSDSTDTEMTITLRPYSDGPRSYSDTWKDFRISSWDTTRGWAEHCRGLVRAVDRQKRSSHSIEAPDNADEELLQRSESEIMTHANNPVREAELYDVLDQVGAGYGRSFQVLRNCYTGSGHCRGDIYLPNTADTMPREFESELTIHPTLLDGILHLTWPILGATTGKFNNLYMPTSIRSVTVQASRIVKVPGENLSVWCTGTPDLAAPKATLFDIHATRPGQTGQPAVTISGLVMTPIRDGRSETVKAKSLCYKTVSQPFEEHKPVDSPFAQDSDSESQYNGESGAEDSISLAPWPTSKDDSTFLVLHFDDNEAQCAEVLKAIAHRTSLPASSISLKEQVECIGRKIAILQTGSRSLRSVSSREFANLKRALLNGAEVLWVYVADLPESAMSVGLARSVRSENASRIYTLGLTSSETKSSWSTRSIEKALRLLWFSKPKEPIVDMEFTADHYGRLTVQRVVEDESLNDYVSNETVSPVLQQQAYVQAARRLKIEIGTHAALDTLHFVDDPATDLEDNEIEIEVRATGVNFKDIVVCMGQVSQPYIGVECSGFVAAIGKKVSQVQVGQRVMAMTKGAYSTYARCLETSAYPIEDGMTFEEAATIPVVFCTAYYGLFDSGHLCAGESVLIHAAAGGVGQAAIMLAQMVGAEIFATVGSPEKKQFLMETYGIAEEKIFCSRSTSFGAGIRRATNGAGVDVVLNSLAGEMLRESWDCLAPFGRFIEIGKADITRNAHLDMLKFEYNCTFSSVDLTKVAAYKPKLMRRLLADVNSLMKRGDVSPISPIRTYPISETESAFRALQSGKTLGKLVVVPSRGSQVMATIPKIGTNILHPDGTYIIIGGGGGLGRSISRWMASKGARNIVLVSRNVERNKKVHELAEELALSGTNIVARCCDVSVKAQVQHLVDKDLAHLPAIRGVVHAAMFLDDTLFEQMTLETFRHVTACKVEGALNIHSATQGHSLDFFVALSSIAGVVGNRGQAAYAAANVFLDSFMSWRQSQGLPGISIDLAAVSDVGYLADGSAARRDQVLKNIGGQTIDESEILALLGAALTGKMHDSCQGQCITGLGDASRSSFWLDDARFELLRESVEAGDDGRATVNVPLLKTIRSAGSTEERENALYNALALKVSTVLVLPAEAIEPSCTLKSLGLDSLVAIEIRNWIARETEVNLQVLELLSSGSIMSLVGLILKKMQIG